ncbi:hypothetical protein QUA44_18130 [Microcoleus sp. N9_A2]|uniref:hypothetical protein n=1 Tax=unclassified Microcoleus TaxID=2642155 RepID=UPI002FD39CFE
MSAKFLGRGFKPQPKNNPPKGEGLNPLCFGNWELRIGNLYARVAEVLVIVIDYSNPK